MARTHIRRKDLYLSHSSYLHSSRWTGKKPKLVVWVWQKRERTTIILNKPEGSHHTHCKLSCCTNTEASLFWLIKKVFLKKLLFFLQKHLFVDRIKKEWIALKRNSLLRPMKAEVPQCATCFQISLCKYYILSRGFLKVRNYQNKSFATNNFKCFYFISFFLMRKKNYIMEI